MSECSRLIVNNSRLTHFAVNAFHKVLVGWVVIDIVVTILDALELDHKPIIQTALNIVSLPEQRDQINKDVPANPLY